MEGNVDQCRKRIQLALREETIQGIQLLTVKERSRDRTSIDEGLMTRKRTTIISSGRIEELATSKEGEKTVLTAAKLYYEHWGD